MLLLLRLSRISKGSCLTFCLIIFINLMVLITLMILITLVLLWMLIPSLVVPLPRRY